MLFSPVAHTPRLSSCETGALDGFSPVSPPAPGDVQLSAVYGCPPPLATRKGICTIVSVQSSFYAVDRWQSYQTKLTKWNLPIKTNWSDEQANAPFGKVVRSNGHCPIRFWVLTPTSPPPLSNVYSVLWGTFCGPFLHHLFFDIAKLS